MMPVRLPDKYEVRSAPSTGRRPYVAAAVAGGVVLFDLSSKVVAHRWGASTVPAYRNPGYLLGLVTGSPVLLALVSLVVLFVVTAYVTRRLPGAVPGWCGGLVIGGSTSNIIDRAVSGAVTDFIHTPWVIFNLADLAVLIGTIVAVPRMLTALRTSTR